MDRRTRSQYEELFLLAAPTYGWFSSTDAHEAGISASVLTRLRSRGAVLTPRRNVNRLVSFPESWESRAFGDLMAAGPTACLGRWAALRLHERRTTSPRIDVVLPRDDQRPVPSGLARTHVRLTPEDIWIIDGFRVSSPAFTICDLAAVCELDTLQEVADRFIADARLDLAALRDMVGRFRAVKGVDRLRELLTVLDPSARFTRSDREREVLRLLRALELPRPIADFEVIDDDGNRRFLDLAWPDLKLAIEIDVHPSHGTTLGRRRDGLRQNALVTQGWTILRFDLTDLVDELEQVVATVQRAYASRSR